MHERKNKKTPWGTIFSAFVFLFAGWVYYFEYEGAERKEKEKSQAAALLPFSNSDIVRIEIRAKPGGRAESDFVETVMVRASKDAPWRVEKPYADGADSGAVETFLSNLSMEKTQEAVTGEKSTYGLDQPLAEVKLTSATDSAGGLPRVRSIAIGSVPAFDGSNYAEVSDLEASELKGNDAKNNQTAGSAKVATISSTVIANLQKDPREFRDKRFFLAEAHPDVAAVEIRGVPLAGRNGVASVSLELREGNWVEKGATVSSWPLHQESVKKYIESAQSVRGNDVWAEDKTSKSVLSQRKLDRPGLEVNLVPKDPSKPKYQLKLAPMAASLSSSAPDSGGLSVTAGVGSERPLVFSVYKAQFETLAKSMDHFRDMKFPFQFPVNDVQAIELDRAPGAVSLPHVDRKDKSWVLSAKEARFKGRSLKPELVDGLLTGVLSLEASRVFTAGDKTAQGPASAPNLSDRGAIRMKLFASGQKPMIDFLFLSDGDVVRVTSSKIPGRIFEVEKAKFEALGFDLLTPPPDESEPETQKPATHSKDLK